MMPSIGIHNLKSEKDLNDLQVTTTSNERTRIEKLLLWERRLWSAGYCLVVGIDEAGRGPLAGPVVAAAVVFSPEPYIPNINDSKRISPKVRHELTLAIKKKALGVGIGVVDEKQIDRINIRQASLLAMQRAVQNLPLIPDYALVDGRDIPVLTSQARTLIKGDRVSFSIAAASIIAKVTRDQMMVDYHQIYPDYGFDRHKGYPTQRHLQAIQCHGTCPIHRCSFRPIRQEDEDR
jgi:ribonuclease HII